MPVCIILCVLFTVCVCMCCRVSVCVYVVLVGCIIGWNRFALCVLVYVHACITVGVMYVRACVYVMRHMHRAVCVYTCAYAVSVSTHNVVT